MSSLAIERFDARTRTPIFSLTMTVAVPASLAVGRLRERFAAFCDMLNLDATFEAARD